MVLENCLHRNSENIVLQSSYLNCSIVEILEDFGIVVELFFWTFRGFHIGSAEETVVAEDGISDRADGRGRVLGRSMLSSLTRILIYVNIVYLQTASLSFLKFKSKKVCLTCLSSNVSSMIYLIQLFIVEIMQTSSKVLVKCKPLDRSQNILLPFLR